MPSTAKMIQMKEGAGNQNDKPHPAAVMKADMETDQSDAE
jgi:hypothetical protein